VAAEMVVVAPVGALVVTRGMAEIMAGVLGAPEAGVEVGVLRM